MPDETNTPPVTGIAPDGTVDMHADSDRFEQLQNTLDQENLSRQTRLISVRKGLTDLPTNQPAATNQPPAAPPQSPGLIQDLLNLFLAPVQTFQRVMAGQAGGTSVPTLVPANLPPAAPAPVTNPSVPFAPATNSPGNLNGTNGSVPPPASPQTFQSPPALFSSPGGAPSATGGGLPESDPAGSFVSSADGQSSAFQIAAGRMQGALEQNSQMSVSMFNQLADAVAGQNRALDEVNRKISQLGGQINSLKNQ